MMKTEKERWILPPVDWKTALLSVIIVALPMIGSSLILRNLDNILALVVDGGGDGFDFVRIFAQTRDANLTLHWSIPILLGVAFLLTSLFGFSRIQKRSVRIALKIVLALFLLGAGLICALLLTRVNDIRFGDLLAKLIPLIDKL